MQCTGYYCPAGTITPSLECGKGYCGKRGATESTCGAVKCPSGHICGAGTSCSENDVNGPNGVCPVFYSPTGDLVLPFNLDRIEHWRVENKARNFGLPDVPIKRFFSQRNGELEIVSDYSWSYQLTDDNYFKFMPNRLVTNIAYMNEGPNWTAIGANGLLSCL